MKIVDRLDLTKQPSSCSEHPLIKLKNILDKLDWNEAVEILTNDDEIPVKALIVIANKRNLLVEVVELNKSFYRVLIIKK